jgi:hypothetical protein
VKIIPHYQHGPYKKQKHCLRATFIIQIMQKTYWLLAYETNWLLAYETNWLLLEDKSVVYVRSLVRLYNT